MDCRSELSQSPIKIPERFHQVLYNYDRYPGAPGVRGFVGGANCQQYAYEFLREFGYTIPDFRSSDLWEDTKPTGVITVSVAARARASISRSVGVSRTRIKSRIRRSPQRIV